MNRKLYSILIPALLLAVGFGSCGERKLGPELVRINSIADGITGAHTDEDMERWREADSLLRSTDTSRLPENDRMYHSLLRVKVNDKAYLPHPADSIIRPVVEYAEKHPRCGFYPEALYYAGRVYSDMGDYPSSIKFFHESLLQIEKGSDLNMKANILSQLSRLLAKIRVYGEAEQYAKESIICDSILKDTLNMIHDLHLLGLILMNQEENKEAGKVFDKALRLKNDSGSDELHAKTQMYQAIAAHKMEETGKARVLIQGVPDKVSSINRPYALRHAAEIYFDSGVYDSAYIYCREIIECNNNDNKLTAYKLLLSEPMKRVLPEDDRENFVSAYYDAMNQYLSGKDNDQIEFQQSLFNYETSERQKRVAMERNERLRIIAYWVIILCLLMALWIINLKRRNYKMKLRVITVEGEIIALKESLLAEDIPERDNCYDETETTGSSENIPIKGVAPGKNEGEIKQELKNKIMELVEHGKGLTADLNLMVDAEILEDIRERLSQKKVLSDADWADIEKMVNDNSKDFSKTLSILTDDRITTAEYETALLIKLGFKPSEIGILVGKEKGTISSRRMSIGQKIFNGEKKELKIIDRFIRLM